MSDCGTVIWAALALAILSAVAAWFVGRIIARMAEPNGIIIAGAIVVSLAVLQVGAKLAVISIWLYERAGLDPVEVCAGQLPRFAFGGTLFVIIAYVGTFFLSFRRARRGAHE